ncbi:MAG: VanZ family protein [Eubacterium sp.]|nr:VanZ family protein [Eubacterium sp.]
MLKESRKTEPVRRLEILLFIAYLAVLFYFLFFAETMGRTVTEREYHYNLMPLKEIKRFWTYRHSLGFWSVCLNLFGNVAAFLPFGMFLPRLYPKCRKFFLTALFSFELSLCVELIQLVGKVGSFDVDDILLNTLGGAFGYLCYSISKKLFSKRRKDEAGKP